MFLSAPRKWPPSATFRPTPSTGRSFPAGGHFIELWEPRRAGSFETEFSRLRVSHAGEKVLELRWDRAGHFNIVLFKPGQWEEQIKRGVWR